MKHLIKKYKAYMARKNAEANVALAKISAELVQVAAELDQTINRLSEQDRR